MLNGVQKSADLYIELQKNGKEMALELTYSKSRAMSYLHTKRINLQFHLIHHSFL